MSPIRSWKSPSNQISLSKDLLAGSCSGGGSGISMGRVGTWSEKRSIISGPCSFKSFIALLVNKLNSITSASPAEIPDVFYSYSSSASSIYPKEFISFATNETHFRALNFQFQCFILQTFFSIKNTPTCTVFENHRKSLIQQFNIASYVYYVWQKCQK